MHNAFRDKQSEDGGEDGKVKSYSRKSRDKNDVVRYSQSGNISGSHYEPLQMDKVDHHSFAYENSPAQAGVKERAYEPLDVSTMQSTEYAVPVTKGSNEYEYMDSVVDPGYVQLEDAVSKEKAKLQGSKTAATALDQGAAASANSTGYANTGFARVDNTDKDTCAGKKKQRFPKKASKEHTKPTPTTPTPKHTKEQTESKPAGAKVSAAVKSELDSPTLPSGGAEVARQVKQDSPQLPATLPALQDNKTKPATVGKKPLLPKHIAGTAAAPSLGLKGKALAAPRPATKKKSAKDEEPVSPGKVSVAELARRLEKGK